MISELHHFGKDTGNDHKLHMHLYIGTLFRKYAKVSFLFSRQKVDVETSLKLQYFHEYFAYRQKMEKRDILAKV